MVIKYLERVFDNHKIKVPKTEIKDAINILWLMRLKWQRLCWQTKEEISAGIPIGKFDSRDQWIAKVCLTKKLVQKHSQGKITIIFTQTIFTTNRWKKCL